MPTFGCRGAGYSSTVEAPSAAVAAWHHVSVAPRSPARRIAYGAHVDVTVNADGGAVETILVTNGSAPPEGAAGARTLSATKRRRPVT